MADVVPKRILVTGALGFVGAAVTRRLVLAGHHVVALTSGKADRADLLDRPDQVDQRDQSSRTDPGGDPLPPGSVEIASGDVRDDAAMRRVVRGVDGVCHLAALTRVRESFDAPELYLDVNAAGTRTLLAAAESEAERTGRPLPFVQASTGSVYGTPERQPITEQTSPAPTNPYGESKLAADRAALAAAETGRLGVVVLRAFNVAGAAGGRGDRDLTRIIPKALAVARGDEPLLEINGDGGAVRDFVHVDDLARAYVLALGHAAGGGAVFNVGATRASVADIVATVEQVTGRVLPVRHLPPRAEPQILVADSTRIGVELGWKPEQSSLVDIVTSAWSAYRS